MMLGGGFLKQAADTAKYNRSLLGKEAHRPFERREGRFREKTMISDDKKMSVQARYELQREIEEHNQADLRRVIALAIVVLILMLAGLFFI
jgi:hypothetical protein